MIRELAISTCVAIGLLIPAPVYAWQDLTCMNIEDAYKAITVDKPVDICTSNDGSVKIRLQLTSRKNVTVFGGIGSILEISRSIKTSPPPTIVLKENIPNIWEVFFEVDGVNRSAIGTDFYIYLPESMHNSTRSVSEDAKLISCNKFDRGGEKICIAYYRIPPPENDKNSWGQRFHPALSVLTKESSDGSYFLNNAKKLNDVANALVQRGAEK